MKFASDISVKIKQLHVQAENADFAVGESEHTEELSTKGNAILEQAAVEIGKVAHSVESSSSIIATLEGSSTKIGGIVSTISDIADQTNLLALNAAIEAARAGETGRGFAVVADEVRKLAERTTHSTREISDIVRTIQHDSKSARDAMQEVSGLASNSLQLSEQAQVAIREIRSGASQVVKVIKDLAHLLKQ
ncbi:methyl-accepting chemotaxis protein [Neisseriaceae bacterium TC5R-5]|nr:methyl-accepting chemotaxis protein [Neisseriaceae bacterium TC5R-5]